ncbi:LPS export ABC transporter periplasmic protein LptC [Paremcibacter congregatus]|uniref:LPS export ABC transporter periplasmic protein LptC n=1 Tax=Paremcibacter congregatus TaxID=2043170 RepID=A0A2G4YLT5_9PROT|nr:LPS export ABC transporter periplasmic protein LptC [Paremcibacter congregatus]PHZ83272.1 LPS export ABC transporter periplasmic protein LptC [Paremcibacter congregatus]QDE28253.1 LPS export ABC transporter periplasmic protein LptC [Paremcibacter congregatus]
MTVDNRYETSPGMPDPLRSLQPTAPVSYRQNQREINRIYWLKIIVPSLAAVALVTLVLWPVLNSAEGSFTLAMDRLEERDENAKLVKPRYVGIDNNNHPVNISAETAFRKSNDDKDYYLKNLLANMQMKDGTGIEINATSGMFDSKAQEIVLDGAVDIHTNNDFSIKTNQATFLINEKIVTGNSGVSGASPFGDFSAEKFHIDVDQEIIRLKGNVLHHYNPDKFTETISPAGSPDKQQ